MTAEHSPTVRRRRLASELRALREVAKLTCEDVAEHLECSASKISRVETGRVSVSPRDVRDMLELYGVIPEKRDSLVQLARESRQKGWWHAYSDSMHPRFATYVGFEDAAAEIRTYEENLVPGLLQTQDYARCVIAAGNMTGTQAEVERRVALRMARQPMLTGPNQPQMWAVLDEAVLHRAVGGPGLMRLQLEHLVEVADLPNVAVQVIPFAAGAHPGQGKPFVILAFPERADPDVVYLDALTSALYVEDMEDIDQYNVLFNHLRATALSFDESQALMTSVAKGL
ncbi:MAG TPA: helix-turn-helix transcriptional regulator [Streptosporangiaceae bacterium]|jgi:transcriptional regulator with XRE-family HTH domain